MPPIRVLVVDDVPEVRDFYQRLFARRGMDVRTAENGRRALDAIRRERPAVIVTDIDMPVMDGVELCQKIQADPVLSAIPIVVVSGGGHAPAVEALCHAVLEKPCSPDVLLNTVLRAVAAARLVF